MENQPLILISNDDGIQSKGIKTLVNIMKDLGKVVVIAPQYPQSAKSHSITIEEPLRLKESKIFGDDVIAFSVTGSPADCIKIGRTKVFKDILKINEPDLIVSGINHGSNSSLAVIYSGTVAAAVEGTVAGIPSIGFSLCEAVEDPNFSHVHTHIRSITREVIKKGLPKGVTLNVNIPKYNAEESIKGIKIARQTKAHWKESFDERKDPDGKTYYWLTGTFINYESEAVDHDEWAINNNYIAIVPCQHDLTSYPSLKWLEDNIQL